MSPNAVGTARKLELVQLQHQPSSSRVSCARTWDRSCKRERVAAVAAERRGLARGHGVATGERCARLGCAQLGPDRLHDRLDHLAEISACATPRSYFLRARPQRARAVERQRRARRRGHGHGLLSLGCALWSSRSRGHRHRAGRRARLRGAHALASRRDCAARI